MPRRSKGCSFQPPNPQPYPWLMISHGRSSRVSSLYSILEKRVYTTKIPDVSNKIVHTSCEGWLVTSDSDTYHECQLLNLASMESIKLPALADSGKNEMLDKYIYGNCILTAPPTASDCILGFFANNGPSAMIWRPGQGNWVEQEYGIGSQQLRYLSVSNHKIYGIVELKYLAVCECVDEKLVVRRFGLIPSVPPGVCRFNMKLVGSCGDIFLIKMSLLGETTNRIQYINVYKFDDNSVWIKVENIGDRVFFFGDDVAFSCPSAPSQGSGPKGNCIYFTRGRGDWSLYTYDMTENRIHVSVPCPNAINKRSPASFIMLQSPTIK